MDSKPLTFISTNKKKENEKSWKKKRDFGLGAMASELEKGGKNVSIMTNGQVGTGVC